MTLIAAASVNPGGLWERLMAFFTDFEAMFPGFRDVIADARIPFYSIAFVILVYRLVRSLSSPAADASHNLHSIAQAVVFTALVAFCIPMVQTMQEAFDSLAGQMGYEGSPKAMEEMKEEVLVQLNHDTLENQKGGGEEQHGVLYYIFHPGEAMEDGADTVVNAFYGLMVQLAMFVVTIFFKLASLITWGFWLVQQFLLLFNSIFLPAFVAMLATGGLGSLGVRYVMGIVGLLAWPLGWAFVNVGTTAMLESVGRTLENSAGWEVGAYLWAIAICCIIPIWIILGYIVSPFVIQRMVTTGANAAQGMFNSVSRMAMTGAMLAAGQAALAGGGSAAALTGAAGGGSNAGGTSSRGQGGGSQGGADGGAGGSRPPQPRRPAGSGGGMAIAANNDSFAGSYQRAPSGSGQPSTSGLRSRTQGGASGSSSVAAGDEGIQIIGGESAGETESTTTQAGSSHRQQSGSSTSQSQRGNTSGATSTGGSPQTGSASSARTTQSGSGHAAQAAAMPSTGAGEVVDFSAAAAQRASSMAAASSSPSMLASLSEAPVITDHQGTDVSDFLTTSSRRARTSLRSAKPRPLSQANLNQPHA